MARIQPDVYVRNLFGKEKIAPSRIRIMDKKPYAHRQRTTVLDEYMPEYSSDEGALDLFRYFTQTRNYFSVDEIRGGTKSEIAASVKQAMAKESRRGGFNSKFKDAFSKRVSELPAFRKEVQERAFTDYALGVSAKKGIAFEDFKVEELTFKKGFISGKTAFRLREIKTGRIKGIFYFDKE
jgi:hypothetical protein